MPYEKSKVSDFGQGTFAAPPLVGFEYCHQFSSTPGEAPEASSLGEGEIAVNTADKAIYIKNASGLVVQVGGGGAPDAPSNGITHGRKDAEWVDITAPANLQLNRGTAAEVAAYTPLSGEPVWDETNKRLVVGDGATQGGVPIGASVGSYVTTPANLSEGGTSIGITLPGNGSLWSFEYQTVIGGNFRNYAPPYQFSFSGPQGWILGTTNPFQIDGQYFGILQYHSGSTFLTSGFSSVSNNGTPSGAPTSGLYTSVASTQIIAPIGNGRLAYCRISGTLLLNSPSASFSVGLQFLWQDDNSQVITNGCLQRSLVCRRVG